MACRGFTAKLSGVSSGTTRNTKIQLLAAANHAFRVIEVHVGAHGISNTNEPFLVELAKQTSAGTTPTGAITLVKNDPAVADGIDTTAFYGPYSVEPTTTDVYRCWTIHPQTGQLVQSHDAGTIICPADGRLGLLITSAVAVNVDIYLSCEE